MMSCGCNHSSQSDVRGLSQEDLAKEASQQLQLHITTLAQGCLGKYGELNPQNLESVLSDRDCVRHSTRIAFDGSRLGANQFAQPEWDASNGNESFVLFVHPSLKENPTLTVLAVSYMLPVINYGEVIEDKHCALFGSAITGIPLSEYIEKILLLAEQLELLIA